MVMNNPMVESIKTTHIRQTITRKIADKFKGKCVLIGFFGWGGVKF